MQNTDKINILGVGINPINLEMAVNTIVGWIDQQEKEYVCVTPAHGIMECHRDPSLRNIFNNSGLTTPDGMSVVWLLQFFGNRNVNRVYGPDLMEAVCKFSNDNNSYRHFLYGGAEGVPERLSKVLLHDFPNLKIVGTFSPPFRPLTAEEDEDVITKINSTNPDIVWVGISTPKQEKWMSDHIGSLNASVLIGIGAAFDFLSGTKKQAPKWIQQSGFEWLFRFANEPKRLWRRYIEYPYFLILILFQILGLKSYPMNIKLASENNN
jgi:N-acetylglucosaminyldiphosphoundecaprenol N-acetyl-beta-D-mannosaminyltransferase